MKTHAIIPIFISHRGCPNDCVFCNQKKITARAGDVTPADVSKTVETWLTTLGTLEPQEIELAFFGGSFTGIPLEEQTAFLQIAKTYKDAGRIGKLHLSTRPDYISPQIGRQPQDLRRRCHRARGTVVRRGGPAPFRSRASGRYRLSKRCADQGLWLYPRHPADGRSARRHPRERYFLGKGNGQNRRRSSRACIRRSCSAIPRSMTPTGPGPIRRLRKRREAVATDQGDVRDLRRRRDQRHPRRSRNPAISWRARPPFIRRSDSSSREASPATVWRCSLPPCSHALPRRTCRTDPQPRHLPSGQAQPCRSPAAPSFSLQTQGPTIISSDTAPATARISQRNIRTLRSAMPAMIRFRMEFIG